MEYKYPVLRQALKDLSNNEKDYLLSYLYHYAEIDEKFVKTLMHGVDCTKEASKEFNLSD